MIVESPLIFLHIHNTEAKGGQHKSIEFFTVYTKLAEMALLTSKDLRTVKSGARPDARDYYWFRSPVPNQMS